jgi:hypothetical protein
MILATPGQTQSPDDCVCQPSDPNANAKARSSNANAQLMCVVGVFPMECRMDWQPEDQVPVNFENKLNQFNDKLDEIGEPLPDPIDPILLHRLLYRGGAAEPDPNFPYGSAPRLVLAGYVATAASKAEELGSSLVGEDIVRTAAGNIEALAQAIATPAGGMRAKGELGELIARFACLSFEAFAKEGLTRISVSAQAGRRLEGSC